MKFIKIFLYVTSALLFFALLIAAYIWWQLQVLQNLPLEVDEVISDTTVGTVSKEDERSVILPQENPVAAQIKEPITIKNESLTEPQAEVLEKIGIDIEGIAITQEMIACAEDELGSVRLEEIMEGAAPGSLEALRLLGCANN